MALPQPLRRRAAALDGDRAGLAVRACRATGSTPSAASPLTPAEGGAYRLAAETCAATMARDSEPAANLQAERRPVKPAGDGGWSSGLRAARGGRSPPTSPNRDDGADGLPPSRPSLKLRRQGETLRIVGTIDDAEFGGLERRPSCEYVADHRKLFSQRQTGRGAATRPTPAFMAPTFDCAPAQHGERRGNLRRPLSCRQDQRLNRAWKTLLSRLDEATRRALTEDQRNWVR